jgi:hypothetical protein
LAWEKRRFSNRKRSGDTFLVRGVSVLQYAVFTALDCQVST